MRSIELRLKDDHYSIRIGPEILTRAGEILVPLNLGRDAVVITHPVLNRLYGENLRRGLVRNGYSVKILTVPEGEGSKSAQTAFALFNKIAAYDVQRKIFIIALGGGVIGDLAGFAASCYKRGIPCVQIPTTLLAQIDSAIGGKVAIDLPLGKNLVGAFYQPRAVLSDVGVLSTLSLRQIRNGLAEAIKYGMICDKNFFQYLEKNYQKILALDPKTLSDVVFTCSRIKADVVMRDEKETKGIRTILNFGHTVGHAIEAAGGYRRYQHGEAVAAGMRIAAEISQRMGLLSRDNVLRLERLLTAVGLPTQVRGIPLKNICKLMQHDKKFVGRKNRFVLAREIGRVEVVAEVPLKIIQASINACEGYTQRAYKM